MKYSEIKEVFKLQNGKLFRFHGKKKLWTEVENKATSNGYCLVGFKGKLHYYHRVVYCLHYNQDLDKISHIDHIDGNKINNSISNLRLVTSRENQQNTEKHRNGKLFGCSYEKSSGKWVARINPVKSSKCIHLGRFPTEQLAHEHYLKALEWSHLLRPNLSAECKKHFRNFIKSFF